MVTSYKQLYVCHDVYNIYISHYYEYGNDNKWYTLGKYNSYSVKGLNVKLINGTYF